jgi:hypothetical protein
MEFLMGLPQSHAHSAQSRLVLSAQAVAKKEQEQDQHH